MKIPVETPSGQLYVDLLLVEPTERGLTVLGYTYPPAFWYALLGGLVLGAGASVLLRTGLKNGLLTASAVASLSAYIAWRKLDTETTLNKY